MLHNFQIHPGNEVSDRFLQAEIRDFSSAIIYVQALPYGRNSLRDHATIVLDEKRGTCSTKHAILKRLADENGKDLKLIIGIYKMNSDNAKSVQAVLEKYKLDYIPEAHTYLRMGDRVIDVTKPSFANTLFLHDLFEEEEIIPSQVGNYKIEKHQAFLKQWLDQNPQVPYPFHELWNIREECIAALSQK